MIGLYLCIQVFALGWGFFVENHNESYLQPVDNTTYNLQVEASDIKVDGDLLSLKGDIKLNNQQSETVQVYYWLESETDQTYWLNQELSIGVDVTGTLEEANINGNRALFNYRDHLYRQDIHWVLNASELVITGQLRSMPYLISNQSVRLSKWVKSLANQMVSDYILSLFFNEMSALNPEILATYQELGMIHLFSISGFHATYLIGLLRNICLRLGILVDHFDLIAVIVLICYAIILGWPYGMFRVVVAYLYNWWQKKRGRSGSTLIGSTISMWLIMVHDPYSVMTLSFQLTFALSYVVILMGKVIQKRYQQPLVQELVLSLVCTQVTIPFLVYHAHEFSWASLVFNYGYSAFFTIVMFPGLILILSLHGLGLANSLTWLQDGLAILIRLLERISLYLNEIKILKWTVGVTPAVIIAILVVAIIHSLIRLESEKGYKRSLSWFVLALILLYSHPYLNYYGRVVILDVGQGDSIYIELPHQAGTYLVDVAGRLTFPKAAWQKRDADSVAEREILPALRAEGVRKLDGIFLTHGDFDHVGSLEEIMANYWVDHLYLPIGMQADDIVLKNIDLAISTSQNPYLDVHWLQQGDTVSTGKKDLFTVLGPDKIGEGENEDSLVLYGEFGPQQLLLTGDIVGQEELALEKIIREHQLEVDILKIAHHGSDLSTPATFLEAAKPAYAFISVGANNSYGHPGPRLLDNLDQEKIVTYRTDQDGAIHYIFRQKSFTIKKVKSSLTK